MHLQFVIYINFLDEHIGGMMNKFADDIKINSAEVSEKRCHIITTGY